MPIANTPGKVFDYILKRERALPKESQTVFKLRTLTADQWSIIWDQAGAGGQAIMSVASGLTGWENFKDADGLPVSFKGNESGLSDDDNLQRMMDNLNRIAGADILELSYAIRARNVIEEIERKNSDSERIS